MRIFLVHALLLTQILAQKVAKEPKEVIITWVTAGSTDGTDGLVDPSTFSVGTKIATLTSVEYVYHIPASIRPKHLFQASLS